jgi:uncharacterized protein (DUF1810 family)
MWFAFPQDFVGQQSSGVACYYALGGPREARQLMDDTALRRYLTRGLDSAVAAIPHRRRPLRVLRRGGLYEIQIHPHMALASLLAIGQLLCHAYKDGSMLYAFDCWADTAQDRKWRGDAVARPEVMATMLKARQPRPPSQRPGPPHG